MYQQIGSLVKRDSKEVLALVLVSNVVLKNRVKKLKKFAINLTMLNFANFNFKAVETTPLDNLSTPLLKIKI